MGSNIANVLLILGIAALITPIICKEKAIHRDALAVLAASALLFGLTYLKVLSPLIGCLMLIMLVGYLIYCYRAERKSTIMPVSDLPLGSEHGNALQEAGSQAGLAISIVMSVSGIAMLVFGADFLVKGASNIARIYGVSEATIGLSLVAVGTSLPELTASISAAVKNNSDVIIGNILGSNLSNIMCILGVTAMIKPIPLDGKITAFDVPFALIVAGVSVGVILVFRKFGKLTGLLFLLSYIAYIAWMYGNS